MDLRDATLMLLTESDQNGGSVCRPASRLHHAPQPARTPGPRHER